MTLREKIENNLAIWFFSTLFAGFMAGIGTHKAVLEMMQLELVPKTKLAALEAANKAEDSQAQPEVSGPVKNGKSDDSTEGKAFDVAKASSSPPSILPSTSQRQRITFSLEPGQTSAPFEFELQLPQKVEIRLVNVSPPHDLSLEVCGPAEPTCRREQRVAGIPFYRDFSKGSATVSVFNFSNNPSVSVILEVRYSL